MISIETESIVLKTYDLADADKIIVLLTRDHGLIRGVAKGAKRLKSRFGSGLEPFSVVRVTFRQKDSVELVTIEGSELVRSYFSLAGNPEFLNSFSHLVDLLTAFTPPQDPNETLYRMVRASLEASSIQGKDLLGVEVYFELWLLRLSGYLPDWAACSICKSEFNAKENSHLNNSSGLICFRCNDGRSDRMVEPEQRAILARALRLPPAEFAHSVVSESERLKGISFILRGITSAVLGREISGGGRQLFVGMNS